MIKISFTSQYFLLCCQRVCLWLKFESVSSWIKWVMKRTCLRCYFNFYSVSEIQNFGIISSFHFGYTPRGETRGGLKEKLMKYLYLHNFVFLLVIDVWCLWQSITFLNGNLKFLLSIPPITLKFGLNKTNLKTHSGHFH